MERSNPVLWAVVTFVGLLCITAANPESPLGTAVTAQWLPVFGLALAAIGVFGLAPHLLGHLVSHPSETAEETSGSESFRDGPGPVTEPKSPISGTVKAVDGDERLSEQAARRSPGDEDDRSLAGSGDRDRTVAESVPRREWSSERDR